MIDSRAVIDPKAELDEGVDVGPFAVIGANVQIGKGTNVGPHSVIKGPTRIGIDNRIFQFASVGEDPQDLKYKGEFTRLDIGDRNVIREFATLNRGTAQDAVVTRIGNDNLFMAYIHVAHDCQIGNHVIMANAASLGGHVTLHDWAILGGFTIVHQFCCIGAHSFCAMGSAVSKDIPPYVMVSGNPSKPFGVNSEGLRRRGFDEQAIRQIKQGYKLLYKQQLKLEDAITQLDTLSAETPELKAYVDFLRKSERSIVR
ncbi:MAG: acyl-ACP--UDP-N-acetylglucosamine O-acyltransferase [Gammaproteobacteria bacterium]|nr:acyl-ACP--UDP-N-acetylglucosamine O-acyltransferase [Gammaproteobacteria bacterium]